MKLPTFCADNFSLNVYSTEEPRFSRCFMFREFRNVERLSIKDCYLQMERTSLPGKLPSLRWLRSDLTAANVAMLKEERPDITFVK